MILLGCSENFQKTQRKNSIEFISASKKEPLHRWFLVNFPKIFQNTFFYKNLEIIILLREECYKGASSFYLQCSKGDFTEWIPQYISICCCKGSILGLVCGITIRILITEGLIAGRNGILVESLLRESSFRVSTMPLYMKIGGSFFSKSII